MSFDQTQVHITRPHSSSALFLTRLKLPSRLVRDPRAAYKQSLSVLEHAKCVRPGLVTKSSIMLGCGESDKQVLQTLRGEWEREGGREGGRKPVCRFFHLQVAGYIYY